MTEKVVYTQKKDFLQRTSGLVPLFPIQRVPCRNFEPNLFSCRSIFHISLCLSVGLLYAKCPSFALPCSACKVMPIIWAAWIPAEAGRENPCTPITQIQLRVVRRCGWIIQHLSEACICKQVDGLLMAFFFFLRGATIDQKDILHLDCSSSAVSLSRGGGWGSKSHVSRASLRSIGCIQTWRPPKWS